MPLGARHRFLALLVLLPIVFPPAATIPLMEVLGELLSSPDRPLRLPKDKSAKERSEEVQMKVESAESEAINPTTPLLVHSCCVASFLLLPRRFYLDIAITRN